MDPNANWTALHFSDGTTKYISNTLTVFQKIDGDITIIGYDPATNVGADNFTVIVSESAFLGAEQYLTLYAGLNLQIHGDLLIDIASEDGIQLRADAEIDMSAANGGMLLSFGTSGISGTPGFEYRATSGQFKVDVQGTISIQATGAGASFGVSGSGAQSAQLYAVGGTHAVIISGGAIGNNKGSGTIHLSSTTGVYVQNEKISPDTGNTDGNVLTRVGGVWQGAAPSGLSTALATNHVFVGSAGGVATDVAMSGDVTIVASGATTIANDAITTAKILNSAVTLAKMADIADARILGNNSGGASAPIALTTAQTKTLLAITQSDVASLVADLALKAPLASPALTGTPTAPTAAPNTNTTQIATTAYADAIAALKANIASPTLTGTPAAPTAAPGTNTTQIATTAFVTAAVSAGGLPSLADGKLWIGNGSNVATAVTLTGDVTVTNAGVTAIGAGKVTNTMLAGSIDLTTKVTGILPVANGGTGKNTLTDHGVLVGSGTSAVDALAVGTNGQLLIGATGADPAFQTVSQDATMSAAGAVTVSGWRAKGLAAGFAAPTALDVPVFDATGTGTWEVVSPANFFGAWTNYTPTATQSGNLGATFSHAKFLLLGKIMFVSVAISNTSNAGTAGVAVRVGLPTSTDSPNGYQPAMTAVANAIGSGQINGFGSGNYGVVGVRFTAGTTAPLADFLRADINTVANAMGVDPNTAIGTGAIIRFFACYPVN